MLKKLCILILTMTALGLLLSVYVQAGGGGAQFLFVHEEEHATDCCTYYDLSSSMRVGLPGTHVFSVQPKSWIDLATATGTLFTSFEEFIAMVDNNEFTITWNINNRKLNGEEFSVTRLSDTAIAIEFPPVEEVTNEDSYDLSMIAFLTVTYQGEKVTLYSYSDFTVRNEFWVAEDTEPFYIDLAEQPSLPVPVTITPQFRRYSVACAEGEFAIPDPSLLELNWDTGVLQDDGTVLLEIDQPGSHSVSIGMDYQQTYCINSFHQNFYVKDGDTLGSGKLDDYEGGSVTWTMTSDGTLTFQGQGTIPDNSQDWESVLYAYDEVYPDLALKNIVIGEGITYIGSWCFSNKNQLTVSLPSTLQTIADAAFIYSSFQSVTYAGDNWDAVTVGTGNERLVEKLDLGGSSSIEVTGVTCLTDQIYAGDNASFSIQTNGGTARYYDITLLRETDGVFRPYYGIGTSRTEFSIHFSYPGESIVEVKAVDESGNETEPVFLSLTVLPQPVPVTGIEMITKELTMQVGERISLFDIQFTVSPADATNPHYQMGIDSGWAFLEMQGEEFVAIAPGVAEVKVRTKDGAYTAICTITVVESTTVTPGDTDGDGIVSSTDRTNLSRYLAGWAGYDDKVSLASCDLNGDGVLTAKDRIILARHVAGWNGYEDLSVFKE